MFFQTHKVELPWRATGMKPAAFCSIQGDFNGRFAFTRNDQVVAMVSQGQWGGTRTLSYIAFNAKNGAKLADPNTSDIGAAILPLWGISAFYIMGSSQDGNVQATRSEVSGEMSSWRLEDKQGNVTTLKQPGLTIREAMLSPKGQYLVGWGQRARGGQELNIWDRAAQKPQVWTGIGGNGQNKLTFSPDERYLLVANSGVGQAETLYCRELATGKIRWTRVAPSNVGANPTTEGLAVSPDGRFVAIAYPEAIVIRNLETGVAIRQINRRNDFYKNAYLQFSPDSKLLGDAYVNGIAVWDWQETK
jgi:WD40 repeat protein